MFKLRAKVDALHVPYKGSGPLLTDLIGGQIQYSFETMTAATPHVKNGRVIAIAQTRTKRAKGHPNVPTMQEQGFDGFEATTWYGLVGPGKLPTPIAQKINQDVNTVLAMPDVQERMDTYGAEDGGGTTEKFAAVHPHRDRQVGEGGEGSRRQGRQLTVPGGAVARRRRAICSGARPRSPCRRWEAADARTAPPRRAAW